MTLARIFCSIGLAVLLPTNVYAAKTVPTIRIEIPKDENANEERLKDADEAEQKTPPSLGTPQLPLGKNDTPFDGDVPEEDEQQPDTDITEEDKPRAPVTVLYGDKDLPPAVKKTRAALLDIARSGNIEQLRPLFEKFTEQPIVSFEEEDSDAVDHLQGSSGDENGREILAILLEVLESGYVHREKGEESEIYIWPYFVEIPPSELKPEQEIELFRIITGGDYQDMLAYGTYIFYRAGIAPNGDLKFFVAGD